jgi:hypothetical protein
MDHVELLQRSGGNLENCARALGAILRTRSDQLHRQRFRFVGLKDAHQRAGAEIAPRAGFALRCAVSRERSPAIFGESHAWAWLESSSAAPGGRGGGARPHPDGRRSEAPEPIARSRTRDRALARIRSTVQAPRQPHRRVARYPRSKNFDRQAGPRSRQDQAMGQRPRNQQ